MTTISAFATRRIYTRPAKRPDTFGDFTCLHCGAFVSVDAALSGVCNRNHCPYCLSSRHLDQFEAGDRLSACKARMRPIGLTFKRNVKKYAHQGELMLVHRCEDCDKVSINRIAADDDGEKLLAVLEQSTWLDRDTHAQLVQAGSGLLGTDKAAWVRQCLLGKG